MTQESRRAGFSMVEMIVVVAIVAIIAMVAVPALTRIVPVQRLRGEVQNVAAFLRQARLKAANTQKPVRVSLVCPGREGASPDPCRLTLETANYSLGQVTGWTAVPNSGHEMAPKVFVAQTLPERWKDLDGDGKVNSLQTTPEGVVWVIFMPSGRGFSFPKSATNREFELDFHAEDLRGSGGDIANWPGWQLAVSNDTGRTELRSNKKW